jgi:hypothetical protein
LAHHDLQPPPRLDVSNFYRTICPTWRQASSVIFPLSALVCTCELDSCRRPGDSFPCYYNKTSFLKPCAQSIYVVESPEFRAILLLCREAMTDKDIPHHTSVRGGIIKAWKVQFDALRKEMQVRCFTHTLAQPHKLNHFFFRMHWAESLLLQTSGLIMVGVHMLHSPHTGLPAVEMACLNFVPACLVFTASMGHTQVIVSAQHCCTCWTVHLSHQR